MKCAGDHLEICGGVWSNSVYSIDNPGQLPESTDIGCYRDTGIRDLEGIFFTHLKMTVGMCSSLCSSQGNIFSGVQHSTWCFCGDSYGEFGEATNCDMTCGGDANEICGGVWSNNIYQLAEVEAPVEESIDGATYIGCYKDTGIADLGNYRFTHVSMTVAMCLSYCQALGTEYFGVQFTTLCFCGDSYGSYGAADNCDMKCGGLHTDTCGGFWANSVYSIAQPERVPESEEIGCYKDTGIPDLAGLRIDTFDLSVDLCASVCGRLQYDFFGVQFSSICFCGDSYDSFGEANNCDMKCAGNSKEICGGFWANSVYRIGSGFKGGDEQTACDIEKEALRAENIRLQQELGECQQKLEEATTTDPPPIATPDPSVAITETSHEFTLSHNGISYLLETAPTHVALDADNYCEQYGMKLAPIESSATLAALKLQLQSLQIADLTEVAVGERSSVNLDIDVAIEEFNAAGWNCVTFVPDAGSYKLVGKKCQGERPILCAAIPVYC